ncbi:single-stranded DNA-binding protein [Pedobacter sp. GR22-10]|uniref:single-stranded DNA-binding protein n=1 Tax=Pedobacter sp. GR22-10 TaxID=2994472 RepID=UPI002246CD59|nr:single-stranded DNA-binding protein [Pedobacter sp. GR22-10]MCX2429878.1 single-stranded DNA-binding protein [Pedobacter sp. GR22-10]
MQIKGRLTADAKLQTTKTEKQVVNFSIAHNQGYKPKGQEYREEPVYFNCSYWLNPSVAEQLLKGALVEAKGRIGTWAYINKAGEPIAQLTFHVDDIEIKAYAKDREPYNIPVNMEATVPAIGADTSEDLPF